MPNSVYRITPYDPAERAPSKYGAPALPYASREQVAAACVAAAAGFALTAGADQLLLDNPMLEGFFSHSDRSGRRGHGLAGLFPPDLSGYHDGARVPLATGLGLLRAMVLREGAWCRLHTGDGFFLHVGRSDDVYIGTGHPHEEAAARARRLGLTAERVERSPYDPALDEYEAQPAADGTFWNHLHALVTERGGVLLEEQQVANARRWHRLTKATDITAVRTRLAPRARIAVRADLSEDLDAVRTALHDSGHAVLLVQQDPDGPVRPTRVTGPRTGRTDTSFPSIADGPVRRAALVPLRSDRHPPLLAGVLPDADGVVRARWRTNPTPADERQALLASLRVGDVVTGVVASGLDDVGVHVDLDHPQGWALGFLRVPEMSWEHFDSVAEVAPIGREIRAEVLHVDFGREQVALSLKALRPDPWHAFAKTHREGDTLLGTLTKAVPFGLFVRLVPGVEGLLHAPPAPDPAAPRIGDEIAVTLAEVDLERRRIRLAPGTPPQADRDGRQPG
ncbi:S1 RNA-binding domain-containing protein [Streptomyces sp. NPDC059835]|uniref:S1 RNA-binding domain-containing protein n=1 Tax=Streptomyces sp. NPDC059835 TaxID=3346967 RepID=UPI00365122F1